MDSENGMDRRLAGLREEVSRELTGNILPFWSERMVDPKHGGYYGRISGDGRLIEEAPKGVVLCARILWTFAAAYRMFRNPVYRACAERAYSYLATHFADRRSKGVFWAVDYTGETALDPKKQTYAQAFAIYGLSEYYRATGDRDALDWAMELYGVVESHARDARGGGYWEAFSADWAPLSDMRLSAKDLNAAKSLNTNLHVLEALTALLRVRPDDGRVAESLRSLIGVFARYMIDMHTGHLYLFFDEAWHRLDRGVSFGHEIETSWLLCEAADVLGDPALVETVHELARKIARAACEGLQPDGSLIYHRRDDGSVDSERHWWCQAEAVVGLFNMFQIAGDSAALDRALAAWDYCKRHLVDRADGEWHWSVYADGSVNRRDDKAGFWKCPYHNGRMCMELIARIESLEAEG